MPDQPVDAAESLEVEAVEDTASLGRLVPLPWEAWNGVAADEQPEGAPDGEEDPGTLSRVVLRPRHRAVGPTRRRPCLTSWRATT